MTERLNQTMHYQFSGRPEPLVFHAPHVFFDCLWERMSAGGGGGADATATNRAQQRKKRLPSSTSIFQKSDAPPKGTFTKYAWNLTNLLHVKQVGAVKSIAIEAA